MQYAICDLILLLQVYYYRHRRSTTHPSDQLTESSPLLTPAPAPHPQPRPLLPPRLEYPLLLLLVCLAGLGAWYLSNSPDDVSIPEKPGKGGEVMLEWRSQVLGWTSAVLYLGSRVPQIVHN